jgi:hypothetical protein
MVSLRLTTFVFLITSLVSLSYIVTPNDDLKNLISAGWIPFLASSISALSTCAVLYITK